MRPSKVRFLLLVGMLCYLLPGCAVDNEVPPRAIPLGTPNHPPPPRLEGHRPPPNATK